VKFQRHCDVGIKLVVARAILPICTWHSKTTIVRTPAALWNVALVVIVFVSQAAQPTNL